MSDPSAGTARIPLAAVLVSVLLIQVVVNASRPMVSYRAIGLGAGASTLGLIAASFAVLSVVAAIPIGKAITRVGAKPFILCACLLNAASCLVIALTDSIAVIIAVQSVLGLALVAAAVSFQTLVANAGPDSRSDARFGLFTALVSLGQLLGPTVAGVVATLAIDNGWHTTRDPQGTAAVFLTLTALSAATLPVAMTIREHRVRTVAAPKRRSGGDVAGTLKEPGMIAALLASLIVLSTVDILNVYLPAWGEERGWSIGFVSALLAVRAGGSVTVRLFLQPLVSRLGRRVPLAVGCAVGAVTLGCLPLLDQPATLVGAMVVVGLVLGVGQPMTMAWVSRAVPIRLRSVALAVRLTGNRIGQLAIPVGVGAIAGLAGTAAIFVALGTLLLLTTGLVAASRIDAAAHEEPPDELSSSA